MIVLSCQLVFSSPEIGDHVTGTLALLNEINETVATANHKMAFRTIGKVLETLQSAKFTELQKGPNTRFIPETWIFLRSTCDVYGSRIFHVFLSFLHAEFILFTPQIFLRGYITYNELQFFFYPLETLVHCIFATAK